MAPLRANINQVVKEETVKKENVIIKEARSLKDMRPKKANKNQIASVVKEEFCVNQIEPGGQREKIPLK